MIDTTGLKGRVDLAAVVGHYTPLLKRGREYVGRCVAHSPDEHPSMYVVPEKGFVQCFSCGWNADAIGFLMHVEGVDFRTACERLGATDAWTPTIRPTLARKRPNRETSKPPMGEPSPDMTLRGLGRPTKVWPYRDAEGDLLGYVARYEPEGGKEIRCWTWGRYGDEPPAWACGHWNALRPLYGLDRLAQRPIAPVLVVEGEKAADAAGRLLSGYVVVTWPGGAQAFDRADWAPVAGRPVLLWPDNDEPGRTAMRRLADLLSDPAGLACSVSVMDPHGKPEGWDAADAEAGAEGHPPMSTADLIAWARPRKAAYVRVEPETVKSADTPTEAQAAPEAADPPPPAHGMAETAPAGPRPRQRARPRLTVVDGQAVAKPDADPEALPQALSDDALADYFAARYGDAFKYVPEWSSSDYPAWVEWRDDGWHRDVLESHYSRAVEVTRRAAYWPEAAALSPREKRGLNSSGKAASLLQIARRDARIARRADIWDADPWLLGVPGGMVDLREGKLLAADPESHITRRTSVAPAEGPHPLFDSVLSRAADGDVGMLDYLWRWFGYLLTGDTREECFLMLHGPGASGKSTLVKVLADVLGDYAVACAMETFAETKQPKHAQELARLDGARLAYTSETDEGQRWNESRIKSLTGRNKITANYMRANSFEYEVRFKLLIEGNHRPQLKSVGEEMRRRIHLVEYAGSIPEDERDRSMKDKLKAEYPAILDAMIRGCLDWQRCDGLKPPSAVIDSVTEYLDSEDTLGAWIEECCERRAEAPLRASDAYRSFRTWADAHGEYCPSQKRFSQKLADRGIEKKRTAAGSQFVGLALKLPDMPPIPDW